MFSVKAQKLEDATILHLTGKIVIGNACSILQNAVFRQATTRMLILDLAQVDLMDAGSLGVLLGLREWAQSKGIELQLMNATGLVEHIFELTGLDRVFEFCSARDLFCLLRRAAAMPSRSRDGSEPEDGRAYPTGRDLNSVQPPHSSSGISRLQALER
jgi:anti-anti-sigma factor